MFIKILTVILFDGSRSRTNYRQPSGTVENSRIVRECRRTKLRRIFHGQLGQGRSVMTVAWSFGAKNCVTVLDVALTPRVKSKADESYNHVKTGVEHVLTQLFI